MARISPTTKSAKEKRVALIKKIESYPRSKTNEETSLPRTRLKKAMTEKITLRVFWTAMLLCAGSALTVIWAHEAIPEKLVPTFFIVGFANFLIWAPLVTYKFLRKP